MMPSQKKKISFVRRSKQDSIIWCKAHRGDAPNNHYNSLVADSTPVQGKVRLPVIVIAIIMRTIRWKNNCKDEEGQEIGRMHGVLQAVINSFSIDKSTAKMSGGKVLFVGGGRPW